MCLLNENVELCIESMIDSFKIVLKKEGLVGGRVEEVGVNNLEGNV